MNKRITNTVSVPGEKFPWLKGDDGIHYYDPNHKLFALIEGLDYTFGWSSSTNKVEFMFFEGCDLDRVMLFKLTWGNI